MIELVDDGDELEEDSSYEIIGIYSEDESD